jgi:hypothetical protein
MQKLWKNKENRKRKEEKRKKYKIASGEPFGPPPESAHGPTKQIPKRYLLLSSPCWQVGPMPPHHVIINLSLDFSPKDTTILPINSPDFLPLSTPFYAYLNPSPSSTFPLFFPHMRRRRAGEFAVNNSSLTRIGIARSKPSRSHKIQCSRMLILPKWYRRTRTHHVAAPRLNRISN